MRIFVSHASKNKEIVLKFANFLEAISSEIEVFCSSEKGSIEVGKDFVEKIYDELSNSDVFVPIISNEYYASRYCMIELGVAYSFLCNKYKHLREEYIFPFTIPPVQKGQALSGTPIANIHTGEIHDENDIRSLIDYLILDKNIAIGSGVNRKLHSYKFDMDQILMKNQKLMENVQIGTFFDNTVECLQHGDIIANSESQDGIVVNFNMNPYEKSDVKKPNFMSLVLEYVDEINLNRYLDFNDSAEFCFSLANFTNSLKRIHVEFKYSDNNRILKSFEIPLERGENTVCLPLNSMRSNALGRISEICFVIHPDDVTEDEGMYKISKIEIL